MIWWNGLLQHLSCIGIRNKAFALFQSYLSNRYLYVVANSDLDAIACYRAY